MLFWDQSPYKYISTSLCDFHILGSVLSGDIKVTAMTETGKVLGETYFTYIPSKPKVLRELVNDPAKLHLWLVRCSQQNGSLQSESSNGESLDSLKTQDKGIKTSLGSIYYMRGWNNKLLSDNS